MHVPDASDDSDVTPKPARRWRHDTTAILLTSVLAVGTVFAALTAAPAVANKEEQQTERCISASRIDRTKRSQDETAILFQMRGGPDFVNVLPRRCPGLRNHGIAYRVRGSTLCRGETVRLVGHSTICVLGMFQPVPRGTTRF